MTHFEMRQPTSPTILLAWHSNAMLGVLGEGTGLDANEPQPGWYKRRLVKGAVFVPARIYVEQIVDEDTGELVEDEKLCCEVNGRAEDPYEQWLWLCINPISQADFDYLTARGAWTKSYAPDEPAAKPRQAVDWMKTPIPTFNKGTSA